MSGLASAEKSVRGFSDRTAGIIRKGSSSLVGAAGRLTSFAAEAFTNPVKALGDTALSGLSNLANRIPVVGGLLALPFEGAKAGLDALFSTYAVGADRIKELGEAAMKTGTDVSDFQVFSAVVGGGELAERATFKFQQKLGDLRLAAFGTKNEFTRLGLSWGDFEGKELSDQFGVVATALNRLTDTNLRAKAAFDIFGKQGFALMPAITKGAGFIEQTRQRIDRFGAAVTAADVANVRRAGLAKKQIQLLFAGFTNQITIGIAPILAEVAELVGNIPGGFKGLGKGIMEGVLEAGEVVATFIDSWGDLGKMWKTLESGFNVLVGAMVEGIGRVVKELPSIPQAIAASFGPKWAARLGILTGAIAAPLGLDTASPGDQLIKRGQSMREEARAALKGVQAELAGAGLTAAQDKWAGIADRIRARFKGAAKAMGDDLFQAMAPRIEALTEKLKDPLDAFTKSSGEAIALQGMFEKRGLDLNAITGGMIDRSLGQAFMALRQAYQPPQQQFTAAMEEGSKEAFSVITANKFGQARESVQQQMKILLEEANRQREEQVRQGRELRDAFKSQAVKVRGAG